MNFQVEIIIYTICLCIGGPLNIVSFYKLFKKIRQQSANNAAAARSAAQITLLRLHLNIADLLTLFVYTLSQIIWMLTFQVGIFVFCFIGFFKMEFLEVERGKVFRLIWSCIFKMYQFWVQIVEK